MKRVTVVALFIFTHVSYLAVRVRSKHKNQRLQEFRFVEKSCRSLRMKFSNQWGWTRPSAALFRTPKRDQ